MVVYSTMTPIFRNTAYLAMIMIIGLIVYPKLPTIEGKLFPVYENHRINHYSINFINNYVIIGGLFDVNRQCNMSDIKIYSGKDDAYYPITWSYYKLYDNYNNVGKDQHWGYIELHISEYHYRATHIKFEIESECHPFYKTKTILIDNEQTYMRSEPIKLDK